MMSAGPELVGALRAFDAVERRIVALGEQAETCDSFEFVNLRRDLVLQFASLAAAIERDPHLMANPALKTQATRLLAAFRTQNAVNQADWPVIRVRDDPEHYKVAARPVAERSRDFWTWVGQQLGFNR
jgi:hypothetical protein